MAEVPYAPTDVTTIAIDGTNMQRLAVEYDNIAKAIKARAGNYTWPDGSTSNLSGPFPVALGSSVAAADLTKKLTDLRTALFERLKTTHSNAVAMSQGLTTILADAATLEHLNTMTAAEFSAAIPVAYTPSTTSSTEL